VRGLLVCALVLALVGAGTALAARGDPKKELTPADNARARAMLLRKSDLAPTNVKSAPSQESDSNFYCKALDESDLTITGEARSPDFTVGFVAISSYSDVYESVADANASWSRGTSAAGQACLREGTRRELASQKGRMVSFKRVPLPRLAQRSFAIRVVAARESVRVYLDFVALQHSRGFASFIVVTPLVAPPKAVSLRLGGIMADRMARAMRG
jgi:hypothetical protein